MPPTYSLFSKQLSPTGEIVCLATTAPLPGLQRMNRDWIEVKVGNKDAVETPVIIGICKVVAHELQIRQCHTVQTGCILQPQMKLAGDTLTVVDQLHACPAYSKFHVMLGNAGILLQCSLRI